MKDKSSHHPDSAAVLKLPSYGASAEAVEASWHQSRFRKESVSMSMLLLTSELSLTWSLTNLQVFTRKIWKT